MFYYPITFLIIALVAALFGYTGIASAAAGVARIIFFIFLSLSVLSLVFGLSSRQRV